MIGAAGGGDALDVLAGGLLRGLALDDRLGREPLDGVAVEQDVECLARPQTCDDLQGRLLDLLDLLISHAAGAVDHERHFPLDGLDVGIVRRLRGQSAEEQEIPAADLLVRIGEDGRGDAVLLQQVRQPERSRFPARLGGDLQGHLARADPLHLELVAGRVDRRDGTLGPDLRSNAPRHRVLKRLASRQDVIHAIAVHVEQVLVGQTDSSACRGARSGRRWSG